MKKALSIILAVIMVASVLPFTLTASAEVTSGTTGDCTWTLDGTVLTISGNGYMKDYWECGPWGTSITEVIIKDGVTNIGDSAFYYCTGLTNVTIPNSVTSIGYYAFNGCTGLTSITIPNSVTSIEWYAFLDCTGLTSITIPDGVTSIGGYAFEGCTGLTSINISNSVTSIVDGAFSNCTGLTSITIPNSVTSIGWCAFEGCTSLEDINVHDGVTYFGSNAFNNTAYYNDLSNWVDGVLYIGKFLVKTNDDFVLEKYSVKEGTVLIIEPAFSNCTSLTSITIPNSVIGIDYYAFSGCTGLTSITVDSNNPKYLGKENCLIDKETKELILGCNNSTIPSDGSVTSIGDSAFSNCTGLTSINIPDSVTSIGAYAFSNCTGLTGITISNSVTSIVDGAFSNCTGLTSITIPNSVTSIGWCAFKGCSSLASIIVEDGNTVYHSENNCLIDIEQKELILGCKNGIIPFDGSVTSIGAFAFSDFTGLTSITIPDSVTSIGRYAFWGCVGLIDITIPNSVMGIGEGAFEDCVNLTDVYYEGSESDWVNINIDEWDNDALLNATIHYNYKPTTPEIKYGLVTENEKISTSDALCILQSIVGKIDFTDNQKTAGDVDGDGEITTSDALLILQLIVGKIDKFPIEQ